MLVLSRRIHESLKIGDDITVKILGLKGSQVRLGITAPSEIAIHRQEVFFRIKAGLLVLQPTKKPG
jgi:carbon storage regulator